MAPPASTTASNSRRSAVALDHWRVRRRRAGDLPGAQRSPDVADRDPGAELGPLLSHLREPAVEDGLLELELGDAVAEQATDPLGPLEDDDLVAGAGELLGGRQPGRARADDGHLLAGRLSHPSGREHPGGCRPLGDLELDLLDEHGLGDDARARTSLRTAPGRAGR